MTADSFNERIYIETERHRRLEEILQIKDWIHEIMLPNDYYCYLQEDENEGFILYTVRPKYSLFKIGKPQITTTVSTPTEEDLRIFEGNDTHFYFKTCDEVDTAYTLFDLNGIIGRRERVFKKDA